MSNKVLDLNARLEERRAEGQAIIDKAKAEERSFTAEERERIDSINAECKDIRGDIARLVQFDETGASESRGKLGMSETEVRRYSLVSAIRNAAEGRFEGTFEHEMSEAAAKKLGHSPRGFFVPQDIAEHRSEVRTTGGATMLAGTTTIGGDFIATDLMSASLIDLLRNRLVCRALGATVMTGLVGNVAIPKQTGANTAYWVAEDTDITVGAPGIAQLTLTPHTLGAATDISRKLLIQSSLDVEAFVRNDIAAVLALAIDKAAIRGTGTGEPFGIISTTGVNTQAMSATTNANANPSWSTLVGFEKEIAADNADFGSIAWAINPATRAFLKVTPKTTSITAGFLMDPDGTVNGYRALVSNQVPNDLNVKAASASAIILGNWAQLFLAFWSGVDILVNPYTQSLSGTVRVVAHQDVDVGVRQPTAFCVSTDVDFD